MYFRFQAIVRSRSRETAKEARGVFTDLPAQLSPSTRDVVAAAKETTKITAAVTAAAQKKQEASPQEPSETSAVEEKMNEIGTN
ncbi:hypothetical protein Y032_0487g2345 [Ancylostoma ceylanicum]|uniref:Uncharacterized protein n=1 Tax=Ancylostoma ceylanicum TaxID=53326 RepID=A0A016WVL2_9BILA|nr:hypothetical protein Y032_0487g2345 [Ancylostoma ceylanicum]